jgi:hypothetical protein
MHTGTFVRERKNCMKEKLGDVILPPVNPLHKEIHREEEIQSLQLHLLSLPHILVAAPLSMLAACIGPYLSYSVGKLSPWLL